MKKTGKKYEPKHVTLPNAGDEAAKVDIFTLTRAANKAWKRSKKRNTAINITKFATALEIAQAG